MPMMPIRFIGMETEAKKTNYFENALFAFLGGVCSTIVSLGVFTTLEARTPSSLTSPTHSYDSSDFDPRVYMGD